MTHDTYQSRMCAWGMGYMEMARFKRAADLGNEISPEEEELQARSLQRIVMQARCTSSTVKVN